jgi:hypothetical protein
MHFLKDQVTMGEELASVEHHLYIQWCSHLHRFRWLQDKKEE